jgi:hypothetical protein
LAELSCRAHVLRRLVVGVLLAGLITSCTQVAGQPRPVDGASSSPAPSMTTTSLDGVDLCQLLTPADYPFEPGTRFPPSKEVDPDGACGWVVHKGDGLFDTFLTGVGLKRFPFDRYIPPVTMQNGRSAVVAGRPAWVGTVLPSGVGIDCDVAFGTADRTIIVQVDDHTEGHSDPCQTVLELAEIVASRTPPPTG